MCKNLLCRKQIPKKNLLKWSNEADTRRYFTTRLTVRVWASALYAENNAQLILSAAIRRRHGGQPKLINQSVIKLINIRRDQHRSCYGARRYVIGRRRHGCGRSAARSLMHGHDICHGATVQRQPSPWISTKTRHRTVQTCRFRFPWTRPTGWRRCRTRVPPPVDVKSLGCRRFPIGGGRRSAVSTRERSTGRYVLARRGTESHSSVSARRRHESYPSNRPRTANEPTPSACISRHRILPFILLNQIC